MFTGDYPKEKWPVTRIRRFLRRLVVSSKRQFIAVGVVFVVVFLVSRDGQLLASLVTISPEHSINHLFQEELEAREVTWTPTVEVSSLELVATYTARGYGYGLTIDAPGIEIPSGLRKIALRRFPPLRVGLLYQGKPKAIAERFAIAAAAQAKEMKAARA